MDFIGSFGFIDADFRFELADVFSDVKFFGRVAADQAREAGAFFFEEVNLFLQIDVVGMAGQFYDVGSWNASDFDLFGVGEPVFDEGVVVWSIWVVGFEVLQLL